MFNRTMQEKIVESILTFSSNNPDMVITLKWETIELHENNDTWNRLVPNVTITPCK